MTTPKNEAYSADEKKTAEQYERAAELMGPNVAGVLWNTPEYQMKGYPTYPLDDANSPSDAVAPKTVAVEYIKKHYSEGRDKMGPLPEAVTRGLGLASENHITDPITHAQWNRSEQGEFSRTDPSGKTLHPNAPELQRLQDGYQQVQRENKQDFTLSRAHGFIVDNNLVVNSEDKSLYRMDVEEHQHSASIAQKDHPGHPLYEQALAGLKKYNTKNGVKVGDTMNQNAAAALAVQAHKKGLTQINDVAVSQDGANLWALQGKPGDAFSIKATVSTHTAHKTSVADSSKAYQAVDHNAQLQAAHALNQQLNQNRQQPVQTLAPLKH